MELLTPKDTFYAIRHLRNALPYLKDSAYRESLEEIIDDLSNIDIGLDGVLKNYVPPIRRQKVSRTYLNNFLYHTLKIPHEFGGRFFRPPNDDHLDRLNNELEHTIENTEFELSDLLKYCYLKDKMKSEMSKSYLERVAKEALELHLLEIFMDNNPKLIGLLEKGRKEVEGAFQLHLLGKRNRGEI